MTAEQIVARIRELLDSDNVEGADFVIGSGGADRA